LTINAGKDSFIIEFHNPVKKIKFYPDRNKRIKF